MGDNRFEIRIIKEADGSDANLNNLSVEAAKSLSTILTSLTSIAEYENRDGNLRVTITKGSACAAIEAPESKLIIIRDNIDKVTDYQSEDEVYVESLRKIQEVIRLNGLSYDISIQGSTFTKLDYLDRFKQRRRFRKRKTANKYQKRFHIEFFSGKLFEVGGKKPNIHIESSGESYKIDCDEAQAIRVNKFLYQNVKISAWVKVAEGKKPKYFLCDHYIQDETYFLLKSFVEVNINFDGTEILKHIHYTILDIIVAGDFGNLRKFIRLFISDQVDIQRQRAVLTTLKEFRNHEELEDLYNKLIELIEKQTKKPIL